MITLAASPRRTRADVRRVPVGRQRPVPLKRVIVEIRMGHDVNDQSAHLGAAFAHRPGERSSPRGASYRTRHPVKNQIGPRIDQDQRSPQKTILEVIRKPR